MAWRKIEINRTEWRVLRTPRPHSKYIAVSPSCPNIRPVLHKEKQEVKNNNRIIRNQRTNYPRTKRTARYVKQHIRKIDRRNWTQRPDNLQRRKKDTQLGTKNWLGKEVRIQMCEDWVFISGKNRVYSIANRNKRHCSWLIKGQRYD